MSAPARLVTLASRGENINFAILRESIRIRCSRTGPSTGATLIFSAFFVMLWQGAPIAYSITWQLLLICSMLFRWHLARQFSAQIDTMGSDALVAADDALRWSSTITQTFLGAGIWIVGAQGTPDAALFVTAMIVLYSVVVMNNLSTDYRSFRQSMPLLLAQPVLYWSMQNGDGLPIVLGIAGIAVLMFLSSRNSARSFAENITIRFEKEALLEELKIQHEHTRRALTAAESANRSKAAFIAAASHDLRQPLFAISVLADTLLMHDLPEKVREISRKQAHAISVLQTQFDNLLDLSRFDAGGVELNIRRIDIDNVLETLNVQYAPLCQAKGLTWKCARVSAIVVTDNELLLRLLGNLLANAVRYTISGCVSLDAILTENKLLIDVTDTGPGIAPEHHERIFDEFVQLGNANRDRRGGVGMGLSIVRRIDRLLGTALVMQSSIGTGTRFTIQIPMASIDLVTLPAGSAEVAQTIRGNLSVWLVDDDPLVQSALSFQFEAWGFTLKVASTSNELYALRAAEGGWPDAIVLDDMLGPTERGLDIARSLIGDFPRRHILIISGSGDASRAKEIREHGFAFMRKPVASGDMWQWLASATNRDGVART